MNINTHKILSLSLIVFLFIQSCKESDERSTVTYGNVQFSFSDSSEAGRTSEEETPKAIILSIVNAGGEIVHERKKIELYKFDDEYLSEPVSFEEGEYWVTEYLVFNENDEAIYAAPLDGSDLSRLVDKPLPMSLLVTENSTVKTSIEVLSTSLGNATAFGYSTFSINIVDVLTMKLAVFAYDEVSKNYGLTNASLTVNGDNTPIYEAIIESTILDIIVNEGYSSYTLEISKEGYESQTRELAPSQFETYEESALQILLSKEGGNELILRPGAENGKDAVLYSYIPDQNYGEHPQINGLAWTNGGNVANMRSLLQFDLSELPEGSKIEAVYLSLYHHVASKNPGHSQLSGSNEGFLRRVTEEWDENTVTWNTEPETTTEHQVVLAASTSETQNYLDIDVTALFITADGKLLPNNGMMLSQQTEEYYRSLVFASSDIEETEKHPKLVVHFSKEAGS